MNNVVDIRDRDESVLPASEAAEQALWISPGMRVIRATETVFGVTADQMRGRNRSDRYAAPRVAAAWASTRMKVGLRDVARRLNRHQSTIVSALTTAERRRERDPYFAHCCDEVLRRARDGVT